jgi:hypothetical protein
MKIPRILISIDLEELNLQAGNNRELSQEERLQQSRDGLKKTLTLLDKHQVRATFFMTAAWAQTYPEVVQQLIRRHEVAAYGIMEKKTIEQIAGSRIYGCRMPMGTKPDYRALKATGYLYHSAGQQVRPLTVKGDLYEIYAEDLRPLWVTKFFSGRQEVISLRFNSRDLGVHPTSRAGSPRLAARLDRVLAYLKGKGQFMPHIEWLQEQLTD